MRKTILIFTFLIALLFPYVGAAEVASVSILICDPGRDIYELEGHAAMRFRFTDGRDITVNWGLFDFDSPNFLYRFVKGETDYLCGASSSGYFLDSYQRHGRRVVEYPLNLSLEEKETLANLVEENLRPENAVYRYNYVLDNCATRPMYLVEKATGTKIEYADAQEIPSKTTFRKVMRHYHANYPWYQFGIDLALGSGIDRPISVAEKIFAPVLLAEMLPGSKLNSDNLIGTPNVVVDLPANISVAEPTPWYLTPMAVSVAVLLLTIAICVRDVRRFELTFWYHRLIYSIFALAGMLLTFLIFISVHEATSPNFLYLWLNPFALIYVFCLGIKVLKPLVLCYQIANFVALIALTVIGIVGVQSLNMAFYPLIVSDLILSATYVYLTLCHAKKIS